MFIAIYILIVDTITVGCIEHSEDYEVISHDLKPVVEDINSIVHDGGLEVDDQFVPIELFLCSDYKVCISIVIVDTKHLLLLLRFHLVKQ